MSVLWLCRPAQGAEQPAQNDSIAADGAGSIQAGLAATALPPSVFSCIRASDAYLIDRDGATLFAPNMLRTEKVTSVSSHEGITLGDAAEPLAIDYQNGDILGRGVGDTTILTKTKDGVSYTTLVDFAAQALIAADGFGAAQITCVVIAEDYLVFWVQLPGVITFDLVNPIARAYRMARDVDGQWDQSTIVNLWESGFGTAIHWSASSNGNEVMWGEYIVLSTGYDASRRGCGTYYIEDITADNPDTLVGKVADDPGVVPVSGDPPAVVDADTGSHMHHCMPDPTRLDTWYVLSGDGIGNSLRKLVKPGGWTPDLGGGTLFTSFVVENRIGCEALAILDDKLYMGIEGESSWSSVPGDLVRYDLGDYTQRDTIAVIPRANPAVVTGTVNTISAFVGGKTTITIDETVFAAGHVAKSLLFAATNTRYLITNFTSTAEVKVSGDATGEDNTDTVTVTEAGGPYQLTGAGEDRGEGAYARAGAIFLPVYTFSTPTLNMNKGLYVGHGGDRFSTYLRIPQDRGIHRIVGELNGQFVLAYDDADATRRVAFVDVPETKLVDAIVVEKGSQNKIGSVAPSASFEGIATPMGLASTNLAVNGWYQPSGNAGAIATPDGTGLHGTDALTMILVDGTASRLLQSSVTYDAVPALNLLSFGGWLKLSAATKPGVNVTMFSNNPAVFPTGNFGTDTANPQEIEPGTSWTRYFNTAIQTDLTGATKAFLKFVHSVVVGADVTGAAVSFDVPMLEIDTDRWRTHSTTWLPANLVRPDEIVSTVVDLTVTPAWSLFFEWHPLEARENFLIDIPIISVAGLGGSFLQIMWDHDANKFKVEDASGFTSATLETNWRHLDAIKFILASDGVDTTLHVWDPEQGTKSTAMSGLQMTSAVGSVLRLGTDNQLSEVGCGRYADIRLYREELTNSEARAAFAMLGVDPCVGIPLGNFVMPVGVDGLDLQLFVEALTSISPTQDQVCRGDFSGNGTLEVGDVDGMVTALLAGP